MDALKYITPKFFTTIKDYSKGQFVKDLIAGVIVAIIALPLSIALAIASGVNPEQGLYTAVVAGFFISFLGGSRVQIGGPTAAFVVIIYGIIANTSIAALFTAGFVPGFMLGLMMMLMAYFLARRAGFTGTVDEDKGAHFWPMFRKNFFSLMAPVIILGSIYAGICTPVEASVVAVFYALFVGTCITRELKIIQLWDAIKLTNVSAGSIIIVLGVSTLFGRILTMQRIPHQLANAMITLTDNPYVILVLIGLLLLFLGMFMETLATIVILAPIFLPLITKVGIDPVFFGIFWVITNEVALLSPPLGVNLFIAQNLSGISFERVAKGAFPYMMLIICFIIMLILWQDLPLWLPRLTGQY